MIGTGAKLGPYEILAPLGAGGMGEVYRARDGRLGRDVAVKVLPEKFTTDAEAVARFEREAFAVAALSHPNILSIFDFGQEGAVSFVVTELLEGETLRGKLAAGPLPARKAADYAAQIARGLSAAHSRGVVHRDLKPENLFVTKDGFLKILDFGLARRTTAGGDETNADTLVALTEPGVVLGTVGYMSPEQVRGEATDARSDIFSFGAVLFEMLSGLRPFRRDSPAETLTAILRDEPPEMPEETRLASPALERIARRCLEKNPESRFQQARDLAYALEALAEAPPPRAAAPRSAAETGEGRRSVAVLFFKDLSASSENAHLGLGLADSTITELALVKSLLVRPTSAILRYRDRAVSPEEAGRELCVDAVVDGSFQRSGSRLRVTVQLVATADGRSLWGSKIDTSLDDIFQMQDEVSRKIAQALEVELSPADERRMARAAQPSGKAYELYLKGRTHLFAESIEDTNVAIAAFEKALEDDPRFALAMVGLASAYVRMGFSFDPVGDWLDRAEAMSRKAISIEPGLPEGHYLKGLLAWSPRHGFDHATAIREYLAAIAGRPNLTEAHERLGVVLFHVAMLEQSAAHSRQALAINPEETLAKVHLGFSRYLEGRYREGLEISLEAEREPSLWCMYQSALCQLRLGDVDGAEETVARGERLVPDDPGPHSVRGLIAACRGDAAAARREIELTVRHQSGRQRFIEVAIKTASFGHYHHAQYDIACIQALLGEKSQALDWLSEAARNGFPCYSFFERDPFLESIRGEDRFRRLVEKLKEECDGYQNLYRALQSSSGRSESEALA
ncbi:MAG TPA: protein kinase [Thermoanaerobaculia bacterium]|nr:protein kinase [Thermoanaerobaculia bacterium]